MVDSDRPGEGGATVRTDIEGLPRAISPLTANDGDSLFALATGTAGAPAELSGLGAVAAEVVSRAIRNAVRAARSLQTPDLPAAVDGPGGPHSGG